MRLKPDARLALPTADEVSDLVADLLALVLPEPIGHDPGPDPTAALGPLTELTELVERCGASRPARVAAALADILPRLRMQTALDVRAAFDGDPACGSELEAALCYPGVRAVAAHRVAHELWRRDVPLLPRLVAEHVHERTGIDIHPGARIGTPFFIDHGTGVVIGSTTVIGDHCRLYQGVTLGALSVPVRADAAVKRHPTLEDHVTVYAGATILGGDTVVGTGCVVGGGVFLTESVPPRHVVSNPRPECRMRPNPQRPPMFYEI